MANEVKKSKSTQEEKKQRNMLEIAFIGAALEKGGKILDEIQNGSILEYSLHEAEMSIKLDTNGIDKDGNRYDPKTRYVISIKGSTEKPKANKKANLDTKKKEDEAR